MGSFVNNNNKNIDNKNIDNKNFDNKNIDNKNIDNEDDNSIYNNLKIYDEQNNIYVKFVYDISYLNYKKKIFCKINPDFNLILNLFDENICDILTNIYILKKKNKINTIYFNIIEYLFNYIKKLNEIIFIDQENFFNIILNFYKINILSYWIHSFFDKYIFKELIEYKVLINKINNLYNDLSKKILIFKIFDELTKINDEKLIKQKIIYLAQKISFDLFMFYDSKKIYGEIKSCFIYLNEIMLVDNDNNILNFLKEYDLDIIKKNNKLLEIFEKNENLFIKEYDNYISSYIDIYSNEIELYIKFKVTKSEIINKFINNISYIDNI
jgi:hypothetical protein